MPPPPPSPLEGLVVLSLEQALTLPFLTLRLAMEGMRVIRLEGPRGTDPNRKIGEPLAGEPEMCSYFLPPNAGKESLTLDLASPEGRALLVDLVRRLPVDVFATNTRPRNLAKLGIDYPTLREARPQLVWVGITGFGPESDEPAYDPVLQARLGWMDLTGEADGPPEVFGLPMVDLGAAEHAYGALMRALYLRERTGRGSRVDVSMAASAFSWMVHPVGLASLGQVSRRRGSTHPFFGPVAVYPATDGWVYVAVGSDRQWERLVGTELFAPLARAAWRTNAGRMADPRIHDGLADRTRTRRVEQVLAACREAGVPAARVATLPEALADPCVARRVRARDPRTGTEVLVPPPPVASAFLERRDYRLPFPPRPGEHSAAILREALGLDAARIEALRERGVV